MNTAMTGADRLLAAMEYADQMMMRVTPQQLADALQIDTSRAPAGEVTMPTVLRALIDVTRALTQMSHEQYANRQRGG